MGNQGRVRRLCQGKQELALVESWLAHTLHKILDTEDRVIRATDDQIMGVMASRSGVAIDRKSYYGLKGKFITRQGRPATRCELLVEVVKGRREPGQRAGIPSEYELGVFGWLLEMDCRGAPEDAADPAAGAWWEEALEDVGAPG
jgi:hypothetical protein